MPLLRVGRRGMSFKTLLFHVKALSVLFVLFFGALVNGFNGF